MLGRIRAVRDQIRPSERKLADHVLANPGEAITLSMAEMAQRAGVSEPTIARFCSALGCSGFREFKIKLAQDIAGGMPFIDQDVRPGDLGAGVAGKVFDRTIATLMQVRNNLSADTVDRAADLLAGARRIEFYGSGNSGTIAEDIQRRFFRLGTPTVAYSDSHVYFVSALSLGPGDAVVVVSSSGRTRDILDTVQNALSVGARVVAITRADSPLARLATVSLLADVVEEFDVYSPLTSRISHLVLGDILAIAVALRKGDALRDRLTRAGQMVRADLSAD
ncbi:MurR/RpiR family transcriptional regulator [Azospirillum sp. ST 5-10]|uniref:MurR/RpiR family transcriptional regulator n=1 Tax=unclassified Azospirillum TaxID=2630922 RepID=UPI003F49D257